MANILAEDHMGNVKNNKDILTSDIGWAQNTEFLGCWDYMKLI